VEFFAPPMQGAQEFADAVLVQPDGKILVAGSARQGQIRFAPIQGALACFNANGTLDTSFGTGGKILSSSLPNGITALGQDAAGNIFTLPIRVEFSPTGQADAGVTPAPIAASSRGGSSVFLPSGQFVQATGVTVAKHDVDIQVQRFNADGSLASPSLAFDYSGAAGLDQAIDGAGAVAIQANGQAVAGGAHFLSTSPFGLARVNPDGTLDTGFGSGGVLTTTFNGNEAVEAVLIQPDGMASASAAMRNHASAGLFSRSLRVVSPCRLLQGRGTGRIVLGCFRRRNAARSAGTIPPQTPCWPISQNRSDSSRHWVRTKQVTQTVIAAAASWRALPASALAGNHWSGSRLLSAQRAFLMTRAHKA
jgi:uncharacterized delta-60 repeat protein